MSDAARRKENVPALTPYLILGFIVLLLALVARAPASLLQKAVPASLPLQVSAWGGTLWHGQAEFRQGPEAGFLRWDLQPSRLLRGRLGFSTRAQGALQLSGTVDLGLGGWRLQGLRGDVPVRFFQSLLPPGWSLPGSLEAEQVMLARQGLGNGAWAAASGGLRWAGGAMQYNLSGQPQGATLPPLQALLRLDKETLVVTLGEAAGTLAEVRIAPDGTVETRLRERLLRYSNRTSGADPDAVVVTSTQKPR
ncbi:MAG: ral secretion pathway protein [Moraxellaceae bacterium]|jgi:hypothetical protein|nr:ral secretion pathway protein [Moraxellaceae bacterium]